MISGEWSPVAFNFEKTALEIIFISREIVFITLDTDFKSLETVFITLEMDSKSLETVSKSWEMDFIALETVSESLETVFITLEMDSKSLETVFISCEDFLLFCPDGYFLCRFFYFVRALKRSVRARQIANHVLYAACYAPVVSMTVFPDDPALPGRDAALLRLLPNGKSGFAQRQAGCGTGAGLKPKRQ
jgi:hypothetical protein